MKPQGWVSRKNARSFADSVKLPLKHFVDFPEEAARFPAEWKRKKVVTFCTGGIRCEKAALHMRDIGMSDVYQLEGGILKYLEQTDGTHWHGDCFVFDGRVAVDNALTPAGIPMPAPRARGKDPDA